VLRILVTGGPPARIRERDGEKIAREVAARLIDSLAAK
jgi:hypothetical protein